MDEEELVFIRFVLETSCLMMYTSEENKINVIDSKFYNRFTDLPRTKEEESQFMKVLEQDARQMMDKHNITGAVLDVTALDRICYSE